MVHKAAIYSMKGQCQLMICRVHIRVSKGAFHSFFVVDGSMVKWTPKSNISFLSSFPVPFEIVINGLGGQNSYQRSKMCED